MSHAPAHTPARAFSLVEAAISIVIVAVMLVAAINVAGSAGSARIYESERTQGAAIAQQLLAEITSQSWLDPDADETGEVSTWDDVTDYNGFTESPPADSDGNHISGYTGWTRAATVTTGFNGLSGLKVITVTVPGSNPPRWRSPTTARRPSAR